VTSQGRSALHVACSNSKPLVAEALLTLGANIHQKDTESAWTPLHRAIHYACLEIAVLLKRFGASFDVLDSDFFTPLQLIPQLSQQQKIELSVVVWGKNKNYNLGLGNVTTRNHPEAVKGLPMIVKASVNKFHSLFLTPTGALWGCGHSKEGRLGIGTENTVTSPQEIVVKFGHRNERIVEVSAGMSHSLILTNKAVYGTGSNKHLQLGMKNVETTLVFKEVPLDRADIDMKNMLSVVATDYHSIFVSRNGVFVCGLNVGQFAGIQEVCWDLENT
jgi:inhibitor of Bruton tyrosine kinase